MKHANDIGANLGFVVQLWAAEEDDSEPFADRMNRLAAQLRKQQAEGAGWTPRMRRISRRWGSGSA